MIDNYLKYKTFYDSLLFAKYGDSYGTMLEKLEQQLSNLPITHTSNIKYFKTILQDGLLSFADRNKTDYSDSAIFNYDKDARLDRYIFSEIGLCPKYGTKEGRITILLDDSILEYPESFFTFHDLTNMHLNYQSEHDPAIRQRIFREISQYNFEKIPLKYLYSILSRTFLESGKTIDSFFESQYSAFPYAYNPDFVYKNAGVPEIKIFGHIPPEKFIGFVVWDDKTKNELISLGIDSSKVILLSNNINEKRTLYEYKNIYKEKENRKSL